MDAVCANLGPLSFKEENDAAVAGVIERPPAQIRYVDPILEQTRNISLLRWGHEISILARRPADHRHARVAVGRGNLSQPGPRM
jgi:hypothetical protein